MKDYCLAISRRVYYLFTVDRSVLLLFAGENDPYPEDGAGPAEVGAERTADQQLHPRQGRARSCTVHDHYRPQAQDLTLLRQLRCHRKA